MVVADVRSSRLRVFRAANLPHITLAVSVAESHPRHPIRFVVVVSPSGRYSSIAKSLLDMVAAPFSGDALVDNRAEACPPARVIL